MISDTFFILQSFFRQSPCCRVRKFFPVFLIMVQFKGNLPICKHFSNLFSSNNQISFKRKKKPPTLAQLPNIADFCKCNTALIQTSAEKL